MKYFISSIAFFIIGSTSNADVPVEGYYKKNGTYTESHYRSNPNSSTLDNWSTKGNINPYTGHVGTKTPYESSSYSTNPSYNFHQKKLFDEPFKFK